MMPSDRRAVPMTGSAGNRVLATRLLLAVVSLFSERLFLFVVFRTFNFFNREHFADNIRKCTNDCHQVIRLTRLYWTAFDVHLARDPLTEAVESGLSASRMMLAVRGANRLQTQSLSSLVVALMLCDRIKDAVDVLDVMQSDGRAESRCWYFCGCIQFVLTLGVRVALVEDCISYSDEILAQRMLSKRPQLLFSLACSLCLYYRPAQLLHKRSNDDWLYLCGKIAIH